jgi:ribulose-phosphate 3-epimerase
LEWVIEELDFVLVMSVNPGFGGQTFIENSLTKIRSFRQMADSRQLSTMIQVDGGVNEKTIAGIAEAGADIFVAGSAIFGTENYKTAIDGFRNIINNVNRKQSEKNDNGK